MTILIAGITPDMYTSTPTEALIIKMGYSACGAVSDLLTHPIFAVLWILVMCVYAMRASLQGASGYGLTPWGRWFWTFGMSLIAWSLIGIPSAGDVRIGPIMDPELDSSWDELPVVTADDEYAEMVDPVTNVRWGFRLINGSFGQFSASMTSAVGSAVEVRDPMTHARNALELSTTTLGKGGGEVMASFETLAKNCWSSQTAPISEPGTPVKDYFSQSTEPLYEGGPDCVQLYRDFEDHSRAAATNDPALEYMVAGDGLQLMGTMLGLPGAMTEAELENFTWNTVMEGTLMKRLEEATGSGGAEAAFFPDFMADNPLRKNELTMNDGADNTYQAMVDHPLGQVWGKMMQAWGDENYFLRQQKLAAAQQFNEKADLIPIIRGFVHVLFAVTFPIAAYGLVLGFHTPLVRWMVGRMVLAMYSPMAAVAFGIAHNFTTMAGIGSQDQVAGMMSGGDLLLGSSALLQAQALRVQTGYLYLEIGLVSAMIVGSLGPLMMGGWSFGASAMAAASTQARTVAAAAMVATKVTTSAGSAALGGAAGAAGAGASATGAVRARKSISLPNRGPGGDEK